MTDFERREFERQKNIAVQKFKDMYDPGPPFIKPPQPAPISLHDKKPENESGLDILKLLNFKNMELDGDRIIILALALILSAEKADELLILALIYIML